MRNLVNTIRFAYRLRKPKHHIFGHTLTWEKGRQLKTFDDISYEYNANGIRTAKTVDGVRHEYDLEGSNILRESDALGNVIVPYILDGRFDDVLSI